MYPEVPCPSRLLYSIYTGREAQCNTTNSYTQSIPPTWYDEYLICILSCGQQKPNDSAGHLEQDMTGERGLGDLLSSISFLLP
jgi:hypothetical protein